MSRADIPSAPATGLTESPDTLPLLEDLRRLTGKDCAGCGRPLCGHQVLCGVALGFKDAPRCVPCLAGHLQREADELRDHLARYIRSRECYSRAWEVAGEQEGMGPQDRPACLWRPETAAHQTAVPTAGPAPTETPRAPDGTWDAGDMGCGDLVLALRIRLGKMPPGAVLKVLAHDPAAPEDLPAWCRLTGHRLLWSAHPEYHIERKGA